MKTLLHIQNRIAKLKHNPVQNAKLIKKWERIERNYKNEFYLNTMQ